MATEPTADKGGAHELRNATSDNPEDQIGDSGESCRVFVSRKTSDGEVLGSDSINRQKLVGFAAGRLEFYDAERIKPGAEWRRKIRKEIQRADILLLILTRPARRDFDWPLYEAGLFDSMRTNGRLICIFPSGSTPPDQLKDIQGVEATKANMLRLLKRLYTDKSFTNTHAPLNAEAFTAFKDAMQEIAQDICDQINGVAGDDKPTVTYNNPHIHLVIEPGMPGLTDSAKVHSDERTLRGLFRLGKKPPNSTYWSWADIKSSVLLGEKDPLDFNSRWIHETEKWVKSSMLGKSEDRQISSRFVAKDDQLWGPEIEIWCTYENGKKTVDITFSPEVHDAWLQNATAPVALAANLSLASRIRHEILETYLRRVPAWDDGDSRFAELQEVVDEVEHDGFFIRWLTRDRYSEAFRRHDNITRLRALEQDFGLKIRPMLRSGIKKRKSDDVKNALDLWRINNAEFFSIGIPRYKELLRLGDLLGSTSA